MTKEGFFFPLPFLVLSAASFAIFARFLIIPLAYVSAGLFLLSLLVMLFFRDPERCVPDGDKLILSPADGRVIKCDDSSEPPSLSIFLSILNVHVTRSPVTGTVESVEFKEGKFHIARKDEAGNSNQRNEIEISTESGTVRMHQVAGAVARRTIFRPKSGERLKAGERVGIIRFGSRVDLAMPAGSKMDVSINQKVLGGQTVLGRLP
jgi:phosphatidylserine decarboxylase